MKFKATQKKAREGPGVTYKKMNYYICAKNYETKERNLKKALEYYTIAAEKGERYNSCIKDFSSVIHQLGHTE
jgi:TPR repeat protein